MPEQRPGRGVAVPAHQWWQAEVLDDEGRRERLLLIDSAQHPDGARVVLSSAAVAGLRADVVAEAVLHDGEVRHLHVGPGVAAGAPPVWFVELAPGPGAGAHDLLAFTGKGCAPGALVAAERLAEGTVTSADQLGAVRWWPETGEVDQVYVQPDWRRRRLGSLLLAALACLTVARDRPRLWGDGERTALGEALVASRTWRDRAAPLEHLAPPMTPGEPDPSP